MQRILIRVGVNAMALFVAAGLVGGITLEEGLWALLFVAAVFGVINAVLKPVLVFLSIPFIVVTFGIALIVINALMLVITDALTDTITIDGFGSAMLGAIVISIVSWSANRLLPDRAKKDS